MLNKFLKNYPFVSFCAKLKLLLSLGRRNFYMDQFLRTSILLGEYALKKLNNSTVAVFGLGGVGSYVVEGLARIGIGHFILIDNDTIDVTNLNRQIIALHSTIGKPKVQVAKDRILDINPAAKVVIYKTFYSKESNLNIFNDCDYVVDAIDSIQSKIYLVCQCSQKNIPIISAMGTGNKLDPTLFEIEDIFKTSICPICRIMRQKLKKLNIKSLKVVYSKEQPITLSKANINHNKKPIIGSVPFVPSVVGLIIADEVAKDLIKK